MLSRNHEEGEEQDSSNHANRHKEEQDNSANIGNSRMMNQRSNLEYGDRSWLIDEYRTRTGRRVIRVQRWLEIREQERTSKVLNRTAMSCITEEYCNKLKDNCSTDHFIMTAIIGDIMYLHQALQQPDKEEFVKSMIWEISTHEKRKHCKIFPIKEVPVNIKILDSFGEMRRKRKIGEGENRQIDKGGNQGDLREY